MPNDTNGHVDDDRKRFEQYIAIWSKAVDTQMHFNEMSVKSRQLGLTFVAAALGVGIVLLNREAAFAFSFEVFGLTIELHIAVLLILGALLALLAVRLLDLRVYHRMLRGAVTFGEDFEEHYMKKIFDLEKGMTQAISHYSRHDDAGYDTSDDGRRKYTGQSQVSAEQKIEKFYNMTAIFLASAAIVIFLVTNLAVTSATTSKESSGSEQSESIEEKGTTN